MRSLKKTQEHTVLEKSTRKVKVSKMLWNKDVTRKCKTDVTHRGLLGQKVILEEKG